MNKKPDGSPTSVNVVSAVILVSAFALLTILLLSTGPVYATHAPTGTTFNISVSDPIGLNFPNIATSVTDYNHSSRAVFTWFAPGNFTDPVRTFTDSSPTCGATTCSSTDTLPGTETDKSGLWKAVVRWHEDAVPYGEIGSATAFFTVQSFPAYPLGILPLIATVIAVAAYAKREKLTRPRD